MADMTSETATVAEDVIRFTPNVGAASVLEEVRHTPAPFAHEIRETGIGAVLTGAVEMLELGANRTMVATSNSATHAMNSVLDDYQRRDAINDKLTYPVPTTRADQAPQERQIEGPATITYALEYLWLLTNGVNEAMPGISRGALEAAERVQEALPGLPPAVTDIMRRKVLAGAAWGMVEKERDDLVTTINGDHHGLYRLADEVQQHYKQTETLQPEHIHGLLSHLGLNEHAEAIIGHIPGAVLKEAQRLPVIGEFVKRVVGVAQKLGDKQGEIRRYITAETDNAVRGLIHLGPNEHLNTASMQTAVDALEDMAAFLGPDVIPEGVDRAELAQALLARSVLENPAAVFGAGQNDPLGRQIAEELIMLALFDLHEVESDSRLQTAARIAREARGAQAASVAITATVEDGSGAN